jgi:hypothetical protein
MLPTTDVFAGAVIKGDKVMDLATNLTGEINKPKTIFDELF